MVLAEIETHLGIALDNLLRPKAYQGLTWNPMINRLPIQVWGVMHLTLGLALIVSMYYTDQLTWMFRGALLFSITLYLLSFGLILEGSLQPRPPVIVLPHPHYGGPLYLPILIVFPLLASIAAYLEPMVNPASIIQRRRD